MPYTDLQVTANMRHDSGASLSCQDIAVSDSELVGAWSDFSVLLIGLLSGSISARPMSLMRLELQALIGKARIARLGVFKAIRGR